MPLTQDFAWITTPLPEGELALRRASITEALSQPFRGEIELLSENTAVSFDAIIGQPVSIRMETDGGFRYFHGIASAFSHFGGDRYAAYSVQMVPWLWLLTQTSDCRIFQQKTVPEIIAQVFRDRGFTDFEPRLTGAYDKRIYCAQYRETDFNFVSRLMEQEGIYYFFEHQANKHTLVLADSPGAHPESPAPYARVRYRPYSSESIAGEFMREWTVDRTLLPGAFAHTDYNFEAPRNPLLSRGEITRAHAHSGMEVFDFPGEYTARGSGERLARVRIEEIQSRHESASGQADVRGLGAGYKFQLQDAPRPDHNRSHLVTSAVHTIQTARFESGGNAGGVPYHCSLTAIDATQTFRPARTTPKPLVQGPQTAVVVGPKGEEIYTDEYGRIKVQFHWDREGKKNENSSCWVRVATPWAGNQWGMIHIPRIGQEVVVSFLEGDPDQPIIIGSVYNADQMPPYKLPADKTQSGVKSRSSKGGNPETFNEFCFEDKKGEELVYLRAEKDHTIAVENDESHWVGNDRMKTVDRDETTEIGRNRTETVNKDETITIIGNRTEKVVQNEDITIAGKRTEKVVQTEDITIGMSRTEKVGVSESIQVGVSRSTTIGVSDSLVVGTSHSTTVGASDSTVAGGTMSLTAGAAITITAGGAVAITAASITLTAATINLVSPAVTVSQRFVIPGPIPLPIIP